MAKEGRKRVLGIVGSPRQGGNTDILVDEILEGARDAGAHAEKVWLSDMAIGPCQACFSCRQGDRCGCVQTDDMEEILEKMRSSDVWVLGTPVYWWGPSAQMKAFVDRWFSVATDPERKTMFEGRKVILAIPMGDSDPATGRHVVGMFTDALKYVKADLVASVLAPGAYDPGEVRNYPEVLERARSAGRNAVK